MECHQGKTLELALDEEIIEDSEEVVTIYPRDQCWSLSIDGPDERPSSWETLILDRVSDSAKI